MIGNKIRFAFILVLLCFVPVLIKFKPERPVHPVETKVVEEKIASGSGFFFVSKDRHHTHVDIQAFMRTLVGDRYTSEWDK